VEIISHSIEEGCAELFDRLCGVSHFLEKGCEGLVTPWKKIVMDYSHCMEQVVSED
jgi:hypothetical protein